MLFILQHPNLLVRPDSSSENVRYPLFISSVLGTKILEVAVCGRGSDCSGATGAADEDEPNILVATACGLHRLVCSVTGAGANTLEVVTFGREHGTGRFGSGGNDANNLLVTAYGRDTEDV